MDLKKPDFLEKLKNVRKDQWIVVLLVGILAVVVALPAEDGKQQQAQETRTEEVLTQEDTAADMETRLETILCRMDGAGEVQVMITQKDSGEKIVEKDIPTMERLTQEGSDGSDRTTSENERDEATVYERSEDGSQTPYVSKTVAPEVEGVLVLAEGGDNAVVIRNITDAVVALFGVETHKIKVMKMHERRG